MQGKWQPRIPARLVVFAVWCAVAAGCATTPAVVRSRPTTAAPEAAQPSPSDREPEAAPRAGGKQATNAAPSASSGRPGEAAPAAATTAPSGSSGAGLASTRPAGMTVEQRVATLMSKMSLEQKVGQIFMFELGNIRSGTLYRTAEPDAVKIITTYHPGGVILFGGNIDTIDQTVALVHGVQAASSIPLFVAADEEGGSVSRLSASGKMHAVHMPAAAVVGETNDPELALREGRYIGQELRSLGINMDLAPVADLNTNPDNTVIGTRAFSSDAAVAARMTRALVQGLQSVDVSSVLKHFPGHGDTSGDSHAGVAIVHRTLAQLRQAELVPFEAGISAGADAVMIGHLLLPEILPQQPVPATFSPFVLGTLLRRELGFKKIIMTDALNMGAIVNYWGAGVAAIDAFEAGADMLLMPENRSEAFNAILDAVKTNEIPVYRLDESVRRILTVKLERGIVGGSPHVANPHALLGSEEGKEILAEIESKAASPRSNKM